MNEDAEKAYAGTDMSGITINEAMDVIVDTAVAGGYLTEGKTISVDVVECAEERTEELTTQLQTSVQEAVAEKELAGTVAVRVRSPVNCAEEHTESLVRSATERALCPTTASCATAERNVPSAAEQEWRSKHVNKLQKGDTTVMRYLLFYISDLLKNYCPAAAAAAACSFRTLISHCWLLIIDS